jgi:tRNA(fMet)-specific endonuclease VapC
MGVLIDSSILIEAERSRLDLKPYVSGRAEESFYLSVITASELLHGVFRARSPETAARRSAFVEAVLDRFPILEVDLQTARAHARIWAELTSNGQRFGPHDLWLAASCVAHGLSIATANVREFNRIPGLVVEAWRTQ